MFRNNEANSLTNRLRFPSYLVEGLPKKDKNIKKDKEEPKNLFDVNILPKPKPGVKLGPGIKKIDAPYSKLGLKRKMLDSLSNLTKILESDIDRLKYPKEKADTLRKEREYENFLKRMMFKFASTSNPNSGDPRQTLDQESANKYFDIWQKLKPEEKDAVIAASGKQNYKFSPKLSKYLPEPIPKKLVENPELYTHDYTTPKNMEKVKSETIKKLSNQEKELEKRIANLPEKEADEQRKQFERDVFKERQLLRFGRGYDKRAGSGDYELRHPYNAFNNTWDAMTDPEKDEYIANIKSGMSDVLFKEKYGIPSLIGQLPVPKKSVVQGKGRGLSSYGPTEEIPVGTRAWEKSYLNEQIKKSEDALKKKIVDEKLTLEQAAPLIRENEHENFLKRRQFKFRDNSVNSLLEKNPYKAPNPGQIPFQEAYKEEIVKQKPAYANMDPYSIATEPPSLRVQPAYNVARARADKSYNDLNEYIKNKEAYEKNLIKNSADVRARNDFDSARRYEEIWKQLTPAEKNQVMQSVNYTPHDINYYLPPEPILEQKNAAEQALMPVEQKPTVSSIFNPLVAKEQALEAERRLKVEKEQLKRWKAMSQADRNIVSQNKQIEDAIHNYQINQRFNAMNPFSMNFQDMGQTTLSPVMMSHLFGQQNPQAIPFPVRKGPTINDKIMSSFDESMFSPEFQWGEYQ